jgi:hypothetical protein
MSLSLGERILVPGIGVALFAVISRGFMGVVGGATRRMKTVLICTILFMAGFGYSVFWQDKLAWLFGWQEAWKAIVAAFAVGSIYLCRRLLLKQSAEAEAQSE